MSKSKSKTNKPFVPLKTENATGNAMTLPSLMDLPDEAPASYEDLTAISQQTSEVIAASSMDCVKISRNFLGIKDVLPESDFEAGSKAIKTAADDLIVIRDDYEKIKSKHADSKGVITDPDDLVNALVIGDEYHALGDRLERCVGGFLIDVEEIIDAHKEKLTNEQDTKGESNE